MYLTIKFKPHTSRTRPSISEGFVKIQINSEISPRLGRDHFYPENFFYTEGWGNQPTFTPTPPGSGSCWCQCSSGFNTSISREITHKHVTHLKRHLEVSENPHWVTTALHEWLWRSKRKLYPLKKGKCCSVFFQQLKHLHICFPHFLLRSSDEYEKEMSVLSIISFYRQFGQLNHHLIIITKDQ